MKNIIMAVTVLVVGSLPFVFLGILLHNKIALVAVGVGAVIAFYAMVAGMIQEEIQHEKDHPKSPCPPDKT